ncbi:MAG: caspase family protein [Ferruginibacter sp.]
MTDKRSTTQKSYGVLVGVGKRDEEDNNAMAISAADAENIELALVNFCKFPKEQIKIRISGEAKKEMVLEEIRALASITSNAPADLVIIYFSGHGYKIGGKYYLVCNDTQNADIQKTAIEGGDFVNLLNEIRSEKLLVILDCCHAKGMTEIPFEKDDLLNPASQPNRVVLTACHSSQVSYLSRPVSIFTYALIEGLGGKCFLSGDKEVTILELALYVRERVATLSEQVLRPSEPQKPNLNILKGGYTSNFVLARFPNGLPKKMFFKEPFQSLATADGKNLLDMNLVVPEGIIQETTAYRARFTAWMITETTIQQSGDGSINVKDSAGNIFNVHNGVSDDIINQMFSHLKKNDKEWFKVMQAMLEIIQKQRDPGSTELLERIKKIEATINSAKPLDEMNDATAFKNELLAELDDNGFSAVPTVLKKIEISGLKYIKSSFANLRNDANSSLTTLSPDSYIVRLKVFIGMIK